MTGYIVFGIIGLIAIVDVVLIIRKGKFNSISAWIIRYSKNYPIFPFLLGIAFGHLMWSMSDFDWMPEDQLIEKCKSVVNKQQLYNNNKQ